MKPVFRFAVRTALCAALLLAAGCATRGPQAPALALRDASTLATQWAAGSSPPDAHWWRAYGDAQLDRLVETALTNNPNLETYASRVRSAQALAEAAGAVTTPGLTLSGELPYQRTSKNSIIPPAFSGRWEFQPSLTIALDYELDFWGKNRASLASAISSAEAARFEAEDVRLQLITGLVMAYVQFDRAQAQLAFATTLAEARERQLGINTQRFKAGLDGAGDTRLTESLLAQARAERIGWQEQVQTAAQQLAVLAGEGPDFAAQLKPPQLTTPHFGLPSSLPAALLGGRPDVAAARARIAASLSAVEAADAAFYPNINLTAFVGLNSYGLKHFAEASSFEAGVTPAISLPIIDSQRLRANLSSRSAERDSASAAYNGALIEALRQIADPLAQLQSVEQQTPELQRAAAAAEASLKLARLRYEKGLANDLPVILAEAQWVTAQRAQADLEAKGRSASANLARALGAGWVPPAPAAP